MLSPTYSTSLGAFPSFVSEAGDTRLRDRSTVTVAFRRKCTASIACTERQFCAEPSREPSQQSMHDVITACTNGAAG